MLIPMSACSTVRAVSRLYKDRSALRLLLFERCAELSFGVLDKARKLRGVHKRIAAIGLHLFPFVLHVKKTRMRRKKYIAGKRTQFPEGVLVICCDLPILRVADEPIDDTGAAVEDDTVSIALFS